MGQCLVERGYAATTVADVVRVARTSRRSFYQEFADKQECFIELLRHADAELIATIAAAVDRDAEWSTQVRQAVGAYVAACDARPATAWSWIRELPALGEPARAVQLTSIESFTSLMVSLTDSAQMRAAGVAPIGRDTAVIIWGGIRELAASALEANRPLSSIEESAVAACLALVRVGAAPSAPPHAASPRVDVE